MTPTESIPLLIVIILMLSASGVDPASMEIHYDGERTVTDIDGALVVAGGTVSVPDGATVTGRVFVIDGTFDLAGTVDGPLTQLAGDAAIQPTGTVTGEFQTVSGETTIAESAAIGSRSVIDVDPQEGSGGVPGLFVLLQMIGLAVFGYLVGRWRPELLGNVGDAATHHPGVSVVTGGFAGAVLLVLLIFMAFTLILLPVSLVGLVALLVTIGYGELSIGYLLAGPLPVEQPKWRAALGGVALVLLLQLIGLIPIVGTLVPGLVALAALGAPLITYYGLRSFEPPHIPGPS